MSLPLTGVRILELADGLGSPYATMLLSDFGAEVIKVEPPKTGVKTRQMGTAYLQGECSYFLALNRNKKDITVDLRTVRGKEIIHRLATKVDIVTENFRPGVAERLGVGYKNLFSLNPRIIYLSITGFGPKGPYKDKPGVELIFQAMSGLISLNRDEEGRPHHVGAAIIDMLAGLYAFMGIALALYIREKTGIGQKVETSLIASAISLLSIGAQAYFITGEVPKQHYMAPHQVFKTKDGYLGISVPAEPYWPKFCKALALEEIAKDPRFQTNIQRVENRVILAEIIEERLAQKTCRDWLDIFEKEDVLAGPVYDYKDVFQDAQILANDLVASWEHPTVGKLKTVGLPIRLSKTPGQLQSPPPLLGQHTEEILKDLGYTAEEIKEMRETGIV